MNALSIDALTRAFADRLFNDAQPVRPPHNEALGLRVNLEKNPDVSKPHLITTAEAVVALAPHRQRNRQTFDALVTGLDELWADYSQESVSNRHRGWYCLGMVAADRVDTLRSMLKAALTAAPQGREAWPDDPQRKHEIYSSWIMTWAIVQSLFYLEDKGFDQLGALRTVARDGLDFILESFVEGPGGTYGLPFTRMTEGNRQRHETEPNPAMTAYGLTLLGVATPLFGNELWTGSALRALNALTVWDNRGVWDSYREPYEPNSTEGDFEHFTTCWVANALWRATALEVIDDEAGRRRGFLELAKAVAALTHKLRPTGEGEAGLIYVDRGSLRDYSFAVADFLMFLNTATDTRAKFGNSAQDDLLQRVVSTAAIDRLILDVQEFAPLSAAYGEYDRLVTTMRQSAMEAAASAVEAQKKLKAFRDDEARVQADVNAAKASLERVNVLKAGTTLKIMSQWRQDATVICFNWLDMSSTFVATLLLCGYSATSPTGTFAWLFGSDPTLIRPGVAFLGLVAASTVVAGLAHEIRAVAPSGRVTWLHLTALLAAIAAGLVFAVRGINAIPQLESAGVVAGLTLLPLPFLAGWNYHLHKVRWRELRNAAALTEPA